MGDAVRRPPKAASGPGDRGPAAPSAPPRAAAVLFTAAWCPHCRQAKAYLERTGVTYEEVDVDTPAGKARLAALGGGGVPLLVFRGEPLRGYTELAYDYFFARHR